MGNKVSVHLSGEDDNVDCYSVIDRSVSEHKCVAHRPKPNVSDPEHEWYGTLIYGRKRLRQEAVASEHLAFNVTTSKTLLSTEVRRLYTLVELEDSEHGDL
jgi:hypothetical protein